MEHNVKKKIAVLQPFIGNIYRGNETFFMEITNYLKQYYDIDIYGTNTDESVKEMMIVVDCKMSRLYYKFEELYQTCPKLSWLLNCSRFVIFLQPLAFFKRKFSKKAYKKYIQYQKYDLIFPGCGVETVKPAIRYRKKHGTPVIYTGGGGIGPGDWRVLMQKPDQYICISTKQYEWARQYWNQVCVIPNGITLDRFTGELNKEKFFINKGHKLVICVGHLDTDFKRHQLAIYAIAKLKQVDLLILGKGEAEQELKELSDQIMPHRCMIKNVNYAETPYYYKSADLFTLPSIGEPFGIVYIEAMACGLPVVTTDDEVRQEIIGNAGILCDVENSVAYATAISNALNKDWGNLPQTRAAIYDYNIIGEQYHQLIENLICKHPYYD